jgi:hypothetical protein
VIVHFGSQERVIPKDQWKSWTPQSVARDGGRGAGDGWTGQAAGTANRGNGGDGTGITALGSAGGSGIVVVRYLTSDVSGLTVTGGTATTDGSYTVRSFTTVGSATFGIS